MGTLCSKHNASFTFPVKLLILQATRTQISISSSSVYMLTEAEATELALELLVFA